MINEITVIELAEIVRSGGVVIDVRESTEYDAGHIPGAISLPLSTIAETVDSFRYDGNIYVVCHSGGRSMKACEYLSDFNIDNAFNVIGGTSGWIASGQPVQTMQ